MRPVGGPGQWAEHLSAPSSAIGFVPGSDRALRPVGIGCPDRVRQPQVRGGAEPGGADGGALGEQREGLEQERRLRGLGEAAHEGQLDGVHLEPGGFRARVGLRRTGGFRGIGGFRPLDGGDEPLRRVEQGIGVRDRTVHGRAPGRGDLER